MPIPLPRMARWRFLPVCPLSTTGGTGRCATRPQVELRSFSDLKDSRLSKLMADNQILKPTSCVRLSKRQETAMPGSVLVCGGAVLDCIVRPFDQKQVGASRTSMPGEAKLSQGGVGRNLAEVSSRLGCRVHFLSAVAADEPGRQLLNHCRQLGIQVEDVAVLEEPNRTASYTALLDGTGELVGAVADMAILDAIQPELLTQRCRSLEGVALVLCEANLSREALTAALKACQGPVWFDPVSTAKAPRGVQSLPWQLAAPNWDELLAMLGRSPQPLEWQDDATLPAEVLEALSEALVPGFGLAERVLLSLGPHGCILAPAMAHVQGLDAVEVSSEAPKLNVEVQMLEFKGAHGTSQLLWYRVARQQQVRDVTGCGDALLAATAAGYAQGWALEEAVLLGLAAAHATLFVDGICRLGPELLQKVRRSRL